MTSLKSTTGWDANKQTGSNFTHGNIQVSSQVGSRENRHSEEKFKPSPRGRTASGGVSNSKVVSATPATSHTPSSSSTTSSSLLTGGGGGGGAPPELSSTTPLESEIDVMLKEREQFFREKYDFMTGVRIASTLGGFFLLVLLTLLYKSKCKGKHSREPSTLTLNSMPYPPPIHPAHLTLMRGQNIQVNGRHHHHHDFGGGGGSPGANPPTMTLLDSSCYGYMNQVHPTHQPVFSNCYTSRNNNGGSGVEAHMKNPAVLLITAANSESSDEELSELISGRVEVTGEGGGGGPEEPPPQVDRRRTKNPLGPVPPCRQVFGDHLNPRSKSPPRMHHLGGRGNIDINVILPTPSISPSGSENFNIAGGQYFGGGGSLCPSRGGGCATTRDSTGGRGRLQVSRSLSSDNENDQSEMSGGGGDESVCSSGSEAAMALAFGCGNSSLFSLDNLKYVDDTSSENIPTRASDAEDADEREDTRSIGSDSVFACFDHNFDHIAPTYARRVSSVSGTSSGVLVVHSPYPGASPLPRHHHLYHHHHHHCSPNHPPPPPQAPPISQQGPLVPPAIVAEGGGGGGRAASSSGFCEGTTEETSDFRVTLTQAHAQVHHRDSFCSDLESVNDYMETGARRRSSSTQTTLSDLRQALGYSPVMMGWSTTGENNGGATSPGTISLTSTHHSADISTRRRLSVPRRRRSLSPHLNPAGGPCGHLALSPRNSTASSLPPYCSVTLHPAPPQPPSSLPLRSMTTSTTNTEEGSFPEAEDRGPITPATPTNPPPPTVVLSPSSPFIPPRVMRKRSFDAVKKTLSLQCEDKSDVTSLYVSSSNETTPTN